MQRRVFLKLSGALGAGMGLHLLDGHGRSAADEPAGTPHAEKLGWRLACQAWTFNYATLFETIENTAALGLRYLEAFPRQKLSPQQPDVLFKEDASLEVLKQVRDKLDECGVKLVSYGVCSLYPDMERSRQTFEFAKQMGIETIVSEPPAEAFDTIEKLVKDYGIKLAIHNHPQPSPYWEPKNVLKVCEGRDPRIGACADTGHWARSGLKPVECLKLLKGRLISLHLKDVDMFERKARDIPWGTGVCEMKEILTELHRQDFKGVFALEYESNWGKAMPELAECIKYFEKVAAELAAKG